MSIYPGLVLHDRYRISSLMGGGGFSVTFEVEDGETAKVLKVLRLEQFHDPADRQKAVDLFQREAEALQRLNHPGIPRVAADAYFTWRGPDGELVHCLVMEKIEGQNLRNWIRTQQQTISQEQAIDWLEQLADILNQVHRQDLLHRDIKPANIMRRPNGQLVLIDFGAVREATESYLQRQQASAPGTIIISAGYTPPEQMEGRAVRQSDFFALGRTFVYLLTGKNPTEFSRHPRTGKLNWRESASQASDALVALIEYLMAPFPGRRPQTAQDILRCLEDILDQGRGARSPAPLPKKSPPPPSTPELWKTAQCRQILKGHTSRITSLALSPDGKTLATGGLDRTICLWDLPSGNRREILRGHRDRITCLCISPDGQTLASGSYDRTLKLWELPTGLAQYTLIGHDEQVQALRFTPKGHSLVSAGSRELRHWATRTGQSLPWSIKPLNPVRSLAFSPNGRILVLGGLDGTVEVWNAPIGELLHSRSSHTGMASVAIIPDGQWMVMATGKTIELLQLQSYRTMRTLVSQSVVVAIALSLDGQLLATASNKTIEVWHLPSATLLTSLNGHTDSVRSLAFGPDNQFLVSVSYDSMVRIWQPQR